MMDVESKEVSAVRRARSLRVLHVHSGNLYGGIEVGLGNFAKVGPTRQIDSEFAVCFEGRLTDELRARGAAVHVLGPARLRSLPKTARARRALRELIARQRFDLIVVHSMWSLAVFGETIRSSGLPLLFHVHDTIPQKLDLLARVAKRTRPDFLLSNSHFTASTTRHCFPNVPGKVVHYPMAPRVAPVGSRAAMRASLGIDDDTVVILQVSRMEPWKGQENHLEALARLRTDKKWVCLFAGGAQRPQEVTYVAGLKAQAERLGIADRVRFLGQRSDVPVVVAAADIFCQPNKSPEPFGIVFIEALDAGLPVVTFAMGGVTEIVDSSCGILPPEGDIDGIAAALTRLIDDPALRASMAQPARDRARALVDLERQTASFHDAFVDAIETRAPSRPSTSASTRPRPYVVVTGDFVRTGGMDRANFALARHLARAGHETHVVAFRVAPELADEPNVRVHIVPRPLSRASLGAPILGSEGMLAAARLPADREVIVNGGNCPVANAVNWVHFVHAAAPAVGDRVGRARQWMTRSTERLALRRARLVVANSERTRRDLIERVGVDPSRVHVVYLGIDEAEFRPRTAAERAQLRGELGWTGDRPRVVFVGSLCDARKGFDTLFAAWDRLCRTPSWDGELVVVGAGSELDDWRARARQASLDGRISFLGLRDDVGRIVGASDLLVAPSRYEPYGLAVHEALASGVAAMTTEVSGVAERFPEGLRDWLLPNADDDVELAARITRWRERGQEHAPALAELSARLRSRSWDAAAADILALAER